jgi:RNA polymerase sigma factor (sigma-70 family)
LNQENSISMTCEETAPDSSQGLTYPFSTFQQFDTLITRSARRASYYITGSSSLAEDLAQDVRLHLWRALEAGLVQESAVIRRLITNAIRDRIRFERTRIQLTSSGMSELDDRNPALLLDASYRPEILTVARWVASLPGRLRAVFELIYGSGYTQREVSSVLGLSQPRITQLHQELLQRGRLDLSALAV